MPREGSGTTVMDDARSSCDVTPGQAEGPYYLDVARVRRDITVGKPGTPLVVVVRLVEAGSCAPIGGAFVDVWHTDAAGRYSEFGGQGGDGADTSGETFLRGTQVTDADGLVEFETIYPGWYPGRTAHIDFRAHTEEERLVSSQLYFPDEVTDAVYSGELYSVRGERNGCDGVLRGDLGVEDGGMSGASQIEWRIRAAKKLEEQMEDS